ncbi:MAG: GSCFA domain-containing protein [Prevotella sp.]|nr:GSCFA domain-containing protein [Prevotella sp.]
MKFRTEVSIEKPNWQIEPTDRLLFVGSCFATSMGQRFADNQFCTVVNPYGTMYNPVSILHTLQRLFATPNQDYVPDVCFLTLGTNHVYRLKETGEIVDNCEKRPQRLFQEEQLTVAQCTDALHECVSLLRNMNPDIRIVLTVSPIRYAKYGFHGSQLSKATLLLAVEETKSQPSNLKSQPSNLKSQPSTPPYYFPAYEIVNDELRDYRFYAPDMLHPSEQAADYIWLRLQESLLSKASRQFLDEWRPIQQALNHKPFDPDSETYKQFREQANQQLALFRAKYGL